ncbi:potassium channel family protein [Thalassotalea crassostreae]|uniref:potassium channel family protein n=1 Tax=Thalassotalea crassostreae TaxID=1763536 RepID=UPI000B29720F|nr:potassium channel family protein [Thalassotalea crassostreae]
MKKMTRQDNFIYLTISLILLLLGMAVAQQFLDSSAQRLMQSATVVTLLVAVWGAEDESFLFRKNMVFPIAIILTASFSYYLDNLDLNYAHLILLLIFFIITAKQTAVQVLFTGEVDGNKILGAICLFMLFGMIWALLYTLLHLGFDGAFTGIKDSRNWFDLLPDYVYFSFVTLTTLGYGDISPTMPLTRFLVYMQAMVGQFYIAILVASLVGSRISSIHTHALEEELHLNSEDKKNDK